ncbi:hypothetical protein B5M43_005110 [Microbacterium sp. MEC084]|uniref:hypothetical protein n=1 Tax=unclassified Microbacterium TaxID=2609290 RepID=UPI0006F46AD6|nr:MULTISPECIES: hypothetical protein [unclassified Microbacterium]KQY97030.1 hypothetical protein ASD19_08865 [Microbacterium sp. Root53]MCD1268231.1 hypothetical protein [Microbacterium sp. MEC084]
MILHRRRTAAGAGALLALAVTLAACATPTGGAGGVTPSASAAPSAEPSVAPSPSGSPADDDAEEDLSDPGSWEIEDGEVGPIEIGEDFAEALGELPPDAWLNEDRCAWTAFWNEPGGAYMVWFSRDAQTDAGPVQTVAVEWGPDRIADVGPRVDDTGIGLGSTRDEVLAAFPGAEETPSAIEGRSFLRIADDEPDDGTLFFEFLEGQEGAQAVVLTTAAEPSYEVCA